MARVDAKHIDFHEGQSWLKCNKGHPIEYFGQNHPKANTIYKFGVKCETAPRGCSKSFKSFGYHCRICNYDICIECSND